MSRRRLFGGLGFAGVALAVIGGCQAIVGDTVPDFFCRGSDPAACPAGLVCDPVSQRCVAALTNGGEAGTDGDLGQDGPIEDAAPDKVTPKDGDAGPAAPGAPCRIDADCSTKMCGDGTLLTPTIVATSGPVCTKPCCRSSDCPSGLVCFAPGTGGRYCVPVTQVAGRDAPSNGGAAGGATCAKNSDCRSGLCTSTKCQDTCCSTTDCSGGAQCRFVTLSGHDTWACAATAATGNPNDVCFGDADCKSNLCYPTTGSRCRPPCCGQKSCTDLGFASARCSVRQAGPDSVNLCLFSISGFANVGDTCSADGDCKTDFCDPDTSKCADVCCTDADCAPFGATSRCVPSAKAGTNAIRQLHCTKP